MNTEIENTEVAEITAIAPRKRPVKSVAILAGTAALAAAIQAVLEPTMKGFTFTHVAAMKDRPKGSQIASLGLPSFLPNDEGVTVISLGSSYDKDATKESRKAQWDTLRNPDATTEEIVAELGGPATYQVIPGKLMAETRLSLADIKLALSEAETDEERLNLYKEGFQLLSGVIG